MKPSFQLDKTYSVLIPDGESYFALPTLQCLGQLKNIEVYIISKSKNASIRFSRYTRHCYLIPNVSSQEERLAKILSIVKKKKIDIVLAIDQPTIRHFAEHGKPLLEYTSIAPIPKAESFDIAVDKWRLAELLRINNIPVPKTILYDNGNEFLTALASLSFPVLIKPLSGDGGIGIKFFDTPSSLVNYCKEHIAPKEYIVQSYIKGYDIDCSVLCRNGKILASTIQKRIINDPMFFGPTMNIDFLYDERVYKIVSEAIWLLEWTGVVHFDLRFDEEENQVKIIEMNARYWGSIVGSYCAGVNFPLLAVLEGLNMEFPPIKYTPMRYVDAVTALKISFFGFLFKKSTISYYDHSKLKSHLKDPLPLLFSSGIQLNIKIVRAFTNIRDKIISI
jgi:predicted ATP-grasp superfamily ATP-dependent carboligase